MKSYEVILLVLYWLFETTGMCAYSACVMKRTIRKRQLSPDYILKYLDRFNPFIQIMLFVFSLEDISAPYHISNPIIGQLVYSIFTVFFGVIFALILVSNNFRYGILFLTFVSAILFFEMLGIIKLIDGLTKDV